MSNDGFTLSLVADAILIASCWFVRPFFKGLKQNERAQATNYAGRTVAYGLGFVWLFFVLGALVVRVFVFPSIDASYTATVIPILAPVLILVLLGLVFGCIDDVYGTRDSRGFKGHLKALASGHLTTGGLKLFGLSAACFLIALRFASLGVWPTETLAAAYSATGFLGVLKFVGYGLLAGASIALTANFVNLCDLRPGRALKVYLLLALIGIAIAMAGQPLGMILLTVVALIAPLFAVLGFDLNEVGMLGDAGSNPFGLMAGCVIVFGLGDNLIAVAFYGTLMLFLNLASEKVSYTKLISKNKVLTKIDNLGRLDKGDKK